MLTCWNSLKSDQLPFSFRKKQILTQFLVKQTPKKLILQVLQRPGNAQIRCEWFRNLKIGFINCHNWRWFPYHFRMLFINFRTFCDAILETRLEMSNGNPSKIIRMIRPWIRKKTFGILTHLDWDFPLTSLDHICSRLEQSYQCPGVCWCTDVTWDFTNKNGYVPMSPSGITRWWT